MSHIKKIIEDLEREAFETGQKIDWETGSLVPNPLRNMDHHQRALWVEMAAKRQRSRDYYDQQDNNPASAEHAGW